jgi:carboxyl-terminal processing protease
MEFDGLMVSGVNEGTAALKAGLMGSDLVVAINGKPTRYLPLKEAVRLIRGTKGNKVKLTIRRECLLWRRGG